MQTVVELPRAQQVDGIIKAHLHILLRREGAENAAVLQMQKTVQPVDDDAHPHAALRRAIERGHQILSAAVRAQVKGREDDLPFRTLDELQAPEQRTVRILDAPHALLQCVLAQSGFILAPQLPCRLFLRQRDENGCQHPI